MFPRFVGVGWAAVVAKGSAGLVQRLIEAGAIAEGCRLVEIIRARGAPPSPDESTLLRAIEGVCRTADTSVAWTLVADVWSLGVLPADVPARQFAIRHHAREPHRFLALFHHARRATGHDDREIMAWAVLGWDGGSERGPLLQKPATTDEERLRLVMRALPAEWRSLRAELAETIAWRRRPKR